MTIFRALMILGLLFVTPIASEAVAEIPAVYTKGKSKLAENGLAVSGYDPVAYFIDKTAKKGSKKHAHVYKDAEYRFASQKNLNAFKEDPEAYLPQYGGYCAWAVANGYTYRASPKHWSVVDGKLYLNFNGQVKKMWSEDIPRRIAEGDRNWPNVRFESVSEN